MFIRRAYAYNLRPVVGVSEYYRGLRLARVDAVLVACSRTLRCNMVVDWVSHHRMCYSSL